LIKVLLYPGYLSEQDVSKHGIFFRKEIKNRIIFFLNCEFFWKNKGCEYDRIFMFFEETRHKKESNKKKKKKKCGRRMWKPTENVGRLSVGGVKSLDRCLSQSDHKLNQPLPNF